MASLSVFNFFFKSFFRATGPMMPDGLDLQQMANALFSATNGIVAHAGGGQTLATPLPGALNEVITVASANDSVLLPPAIPGTTVTVSNLGANSMQVFGVPSNAQNSGAGDTISAHGSTTQAATATGVAHASGYSASYYCFTLGQWKQDLSA